MFQQLRTCLMVIGLLSAGCSGGDGGGGGLGAPPTNFDPDGVYGFGGGEWTLFENKDGQDIWNGPNELVLVIGIDTDVTRTAQEWAETDYATTESTKAQMSFAPEPLGNGGWWWGWWSGGETFEGYFVAGSTGIDPELQTDELPKSDAAAIMNSFVISP